MASELRANCWFARLPNAGPCSGRMDRAHIIPKQRIRREFVNLPDEAREKLIWHPSAWVWGCRFHHGQFDNRILRIHRAQVPLRAERFAEVFGLEWSLDHDFGPKPYVGETTDAEGGW